MSRHFSSEPANGSRTLSAAVEIWLWQAARLTALMLAVIGLVYFGLGSAPVSADSTVRLQSASAHGRHITVGLNKSIVIETPRDVRDVLVSSPTVADAVVRKARRVYIIGMKVGQANVVLFDGSGGQIASFEINVARDNTALAALLRRMIPGSNIQVEGVGEGVALSGAVRNPADSQKAMDLAATYVGDKKKVSNYISVQAREQVQLRVTVAEVERTALKQLGVNLQGSFTAGNVSGAGLTENPFSATLVNLSETVLGLRVGSASNYASGTLQAMERAGLIRTLAEPNLTAISGEKADFLAGGEFPIPVGVEDGRIGIEFKPFGVGLGFRPVVMSENRISLQIKTEVSEISSDTSVRLGSVTNSVNIPGLRVRRSSTTVELPSGGTMAMAGLLRDEIRQNIDGFPFLKDLPVLGQLFRSRDFKRSQTELVIFVTPYIVEPIAKSKASLPTKNVEPASDMNAIFLGQLTRRYDMSGGKGRRGVRYHGRFGYSYD
ncbi:MULTISPECIES: type II and III secretion system protein family protein [Cohaesibacter]|uniref:type II and III secretion system protein family protein n=1 Tax=Cohaesibacter TaxID=655352 RepID=UPI000DE8A8FF|nr:MULTISPECIES: type II and III secretion system protein family protein [Cohaesibacter]TLP45999.1 type II and III secretion system protein family protein [Cohaesibacter sp. CAU 1516]